MRIKLVGTDSQYGHCPTMYITDHGTAVVQGNRITDPQALADLESTYGGLPNHETAVEIPLDLLRNWAAKTIAEGENAEGKDNQDA